MQNNIGTMQPFDSDGDPHGISQRWQRWRRSFKLYLTAKGTTEDSSKKALLLFTAGVKVQDIFYTLAGLDEEKTFSETLNLLDEYFTPKSNIPFERHLFRQIKQASDETVDQFVCRLRQRATTCGFDDKEDDHIRDQVIDNCRSNSTRRRFLEKENLELSDLLKIARAMEAVDHQAKAIEADAESHQVNLVNNPNTNCVDCSNDENSEFTFTVRDHNSYHDGIITLKVLGTFTANVFVLNNESKCRTDFVVVKGNCQTLLGKEAATKLNVLRVGPVNAMSSKTIDTSNSDIFSKYGKLFEGIGLLKDYKLTLNIDKTVKPIAQSLRRIPYALRDKVDAKIDEMLKADLMEKAPEGTWSSWISPLTVDHKKDGDIRICVDMRRANQAILRERQPIPTVEDLLTPRLERKRRIFEVRSEMGVSSNIAG
ncbi:uncharacterized protein LOC120341791 [Styela clava]